MKRAIFLSILCTSCASAPPKYWELPSSYVIPATEQERAEECGRIRAEMANLDRRSNSASVLLSPLYAAAVKNNVMTDKARMEQRASEVGCKSAFSPSTSFGDCFSTCRSVTKLTEIQCFESCK